MGRTSRQREHERVTPPPFERVDQGGTSVGVFHGIIIVLSRCQTMTIAAMNSMTRKEIHRPRSCEAVRNFARSRLGCFCGSIVGLSVIVFFRGAGLVFTGVRKKQAEQYPDEIADLHHEESEEGICRYSAARRKFV
jgi:hypothetical protein